ncbi:MAG: YncE family protein [Acidobacteria bacterium]|nr:YncE family protein [Acidobacteriota bacterium]
MKLQRTAGIASLLFLSLAWTSCGEVFRPVARPTFPPGGDPGALDHAIILSDNGLLTGSTYHIDVSGDTNTVVQQVGIGPVHAGLLPNQGRVYIANRGSDTLTSYPPFTPGAATRTLSLPPGSLPVFVHTTEASNMYVANSGSNRVGVVSVASDVLVAEIPVGATPVALAQTQGGDKLYSINRGSGDVTVIATVDRSIIKTITGLATPVWAVLSSDGARLYVLNQGDSTVTVMETVTDTVLNTVTLPGGSAPTFMVFDPRLLRVYVANTGGNSVSIINADRNSPNFLNVTTVPLDVNLPVGVDSGLAPVSITPLADGSRAYVANRDSNHVSVINTLSNTVTKTINVGTTPLSIGSAPNSSRVYVANSGSNNTSIIRTSDDTVLLNLQAPKSDFNCVDPTSGPPTCARQSPQFIIVTP